MKLETSHGIEPEASAVRIETLIRSEEERGDFIILSQANQIYLQTTGGNDAFITEYRNGDEDQHYSSKHPLTANQLLDLMVRYLERDPNWDDGCEWEPLGESEDEPIRTWGLNWS